MINRYTFAAAAMLFASAASAANYFFTPEGAGEKDGTSWANAADQSGLIEAIKALQPGDVLCMGAGTFATTKNITVPEGVTILGGFTADLQKGVNTDINYKDLVAYTVWDAQKTAMSTSFIIIAQDDISGNTGTKTYDDYRRTTLAGIEIENVNVTRTNSYSSAAMLVQHANVELDHLVFKNNTAKASGGILTMWGTYAYIHDCVFENNTTNNVGVAIHSRAQNSTTNGSTRGGHIIIDRCQITDNTASLATGNYYGGAMAIADYGGDMYINNSTVAGTDMNGHSGAVVRAGTNSKLVTTNCTFFNCTAKNVDNKNPNGQMVSIGTGANYKTANTICVNKADEQSGTKSMVCLQTATTTFASGGYNVFGSFYTANSSVSLADTDMADKGTTTDIVFGSADPEMYVVNGTGVFQPLEFFRKVNTNDVVNNTKDWELPEELNLTVDQTGKKRPAVTVPGSFDVKAIVTTGIESIATDDSKLTLRSVGNGIFAIEGAEDLCEAYDLAGRRVAVATDGTIDLSGSAVGFYIVRCGNKAVKIVR